MFPFLEFLDYTASLRHGQVLISGDQLAAAADFSPDRLSPMTDNGGLTTHASL